MNLFIHLLRRCRMNKFFIFILIPYFTLTQLAHADVDIERCKSCHGQDLKARPLARGNKISGTPESIYNTLRLYKMARVIGKPTTMSEIMSYEVGGKSEADLKEIAKIVAGVIN